MSEMEMLYPKLDHEAIQEAIRHIVAKHGTKPWGSWINRDVDDIDDIEEAKRLFSATDAELADYFDAAHDLLLTEGWVQKAMRNDEGRCAMGAICDAVPFYQTSSARRLRTRFTVVRDQMFEVLLDVLGNKRRRGSMIADWNDREGRTVDDVLDAFRTCAKTLRNKEQKM